LLVAGQPCWGNLSDWLAVMGDTQSLAGLSDLFNEFQALRLKLKYRNILQLL
jgi:hypothetical protein